MMPKPCPVPRTRLISDIHDANRLLGRVACHNGDDRKLLRILGEQLRQLQVKAAIEFATINGWKLANSGRYAAGSSTIFDHVIRFKRDRKFCAMAAQPYAKDFKSICKAQRHAVEIGKACHIPPCPWSSFHYPKWTQFMVFTSFDHRIEWLPEQISGLAWSSAS